MPDFSCSVFLSFFPFSFLAFWLENPALTAVEVTASPALGALTGVRSPTSGAERGAGAGDEDCDGAIGGTATSERYTLTTTGFSEGGASSVRFLNASKSYSTTMISNQTIARIRHFGLLTRLRQDDNVATHRRIFPRPCLL